MSSLTRRRFCQSLGGSTLLSRASVDLAGLTQSPAAADGPHIGNLYPFVQKQADRSRLELSFLQSRYRDLAAWQKLARARVLERLCYSPAGRRRGPSRSSGAPNERITSRNTSRFRRRRICACPPMCWFPSKAPLPAPGLVVLHCHGGAYVWGKEKVVAVENEHPALSEFKNRLYEGNEHRERAGPPRLRRHHDRHVLLG